MACPFQPPSQLFLLSYDLLALPQWRHSAKRCLHLINVDTRWQQSCLNPDDDSKILMTGLGYTPIDHNVLSNDSVGWLTPQEVNVCSLTLC